jgi:hypothetical protein
MSSSSFDYVQFVNDAFDAQQKYADKVGEIGPRDLSIIDRGNFSENSTPTIEYYLKQRYAKVIEHFGHMMEEAIEARVYVPRRSWKNGEQSFMDSPELRREFIAEMYDILLFHRAILAYAGVSGEEFAEIASQKQAYNKVRKDHNVNGDEQVSASPSEELAGNCNSAKF